MNKYLKRINIKYEKKAFTLIELLAVIIIIESNHT